MYFNRSKRNSKNDVQALMHTDVPHQNECHDLIAVWILRILIDLNTYPTSIILHESDNLRAIGLSEDECDGLDSESLFKLLKKTKKKFDQETIKISAITDKNLRWLQTLVGLTDVELEILLFSICISTFRPLDSIASDISTLTRSSFIKVLAIILQIPPNDIAEALSRKGNLLCSGLLKINTDRSTCLESLLEIPDGISEILSIEEDERQNLLNQFFLSIK